MIKIISNNRATLSIEWFILFIFFPFLAFSIPYSESRFIIFALAIAYAATIQQLNRYRAPKKQQVSLKWIYLRALIIIPSLILLAYIAYPESFFQLPIIKPEVWLLILLFYPIASALTQEFLFRRFYFIRYQRLFPTLPAMVISSTLVFGYAHIIYHNLTAVLLTLAGGFLFSHTYAKSNNLLIPWAEHSIYGLIIFSCGLGHLFY